jgi:hypothetical protein
MLSTVAARSKAVALGQNRTLKGKTYIFLSTNQAVASVTWYVDDAKLKKAVGTRKAAPWDLAGGTAKAATAYDVSRLKKGSHTVSTVVRLTSGKSVQLTSRFTR